MYCMYFKFYPLQNWLVYLIYPRITSDSKHISALSAINLQIGYWIVFQKVSKLEATTDFSPPYSLIVINFHFHSSQFKKKGDNTNDLTRNSIYHSTHQSTRLIGRIWLMCSAPERSCVVTCAFDSITASFSASLSSNSASASHNFLYWPSRWRKALKWFDNRGFTFHSRHLRQTREHWVGSWSATARVLTGRARARYRFRPRSSSFRSSSRLQPRVFRAMMSSLPPWPRPAPRWRSAWAKTIRWFRRASTGSRLRAECTRRAPFASSARSATCSRSHCSCVDTAPPACSKCSRHSPSAISPFFLSLSSSRSVVALYHL